MAIDFNGNSPTGITFNGNTVNEVIFNGVSVWTSHVPLTYTYTGTSSEKTITYNNVSYKLITLTTNGTLTFNRSVSVDIWACGGGSNGLKASNLGSSYDGAGPGGAGAYCAEKDNQTVTTLNVTIGPANTASGTVISGDASLTAAGVKNSRDGGTGGGGCRVGSSNSARAGNGDGKSKYPFGDTTNFNPHCAGGGGGGYYGSVRYKGGNGGTNGGNGSSTGTTSTSPVPGGNGGNKGGGKGGATSGSPSTAASFYGSGGGGGQSSNISGSAGYQGVCYIRVLASEF